MALFNEVTKSSFCSVPNPMGRERLMWSGRGAPRSLVRKECSSDGSSSGSPFSFEMILDNNSYSAVAGYPQSGQQSSWGFSMETA